MDRNKIVIKTKNYKNRLEKILLKYNIPAGNLRIIPELPYPARSPFTPAQAHKIKKEIYFLEALRQDNIDAPLNKIPLNEIGIDRKNKLKRNNWHFLKHVLLHEVSHILHPTWEDGRCDEWAFGEMGF